MIAEVSVIASALCPRPHLLIPIAARPESKYHLFDPDVSFPPPPRPSVLPRGAPALLAFFLALISSPTTPLQAGCAECCRRRRECDVRCRGGCGFIVLREVGRCSTRGTALAML